MSRKTRIHQILEMRRNFPSTDNKYRLDLFVLPITTVQVLTIYAAANK